MSSVIEQEISQLELLCRKVYESTNTEQRSEAEKALVIFVDSPDCLTKCQILLERGTSSYAQLLASTSLTKLVCRTNNVLPTEQKRDIRNYVLNYLATRQKLAPFVIQALIQLWVKITKLGWFDADEKGDLLFRSVIDEISQFLQGTAEHCMIGVQILSQLTSDMNYADSNRRLSKHRKVAASFRDIALLDIFTMSCRLLRQAMDKNLNYTDETQHGFMSHLLKLAHNCLTFDFIGTATDESSDDLCTVQIPTNWRSVFLDFSTLDLFFSLYAALPSTLAPMALSCLAQIASVRRSLFDNLERSKFLSHLVSGIKTILDSPQGLSDPSNYHEFCRLLARLKSNYQLGELVKVENYRQVIQLIAKFTVESLQMVHFAPNSLHYLLSLWQKMVASMPYVKASEPHLLETYAPEITTAYITSRLEAMTTIHRDGLDDPLDDTGLLHQQLEQISTIGRCEYDKVCQFLVQLFDQTAQVYQKSLQANTNSTQSALHIHEGQITWLVYIIGAVIGGRVSFSASDDHDAMDGALVCRVLQLMRLTDSRLPQSGCTKLELGLLNFFEQFRKIYIGEQVQKTSQLYQRLSEVLGLSDESTVLSVIVGKLITNLKYWSVNEAIIARTLQLLSDLSVGYSSVRKLVKLDAVQFMLNNHTSDHFPFLGVTNATNISDLRCRTTFYTALSRLLLVDLGEEEYKFDQFMAPLTTAFEQLGNMLATNGGAVFDETVAKRTLIGLARDLRGVAYAFSSKISYNMLFNWLYPTYTPILLRVIQLWFHDPNITTPVLKLMCELVQNRSQRLQFDSSPNGILLFRECSNMLCAYGGRILTVVDLPKDQIYSMKLKGVTVCFTMLRAALSGGYVNFGVFKLYNDKALDNALEIFIKLLLSISHADLLEYRKLSQAFYSLLECLTQNHITFISNLELHVFLYILSSIQEGLTSVDTVICTCCCTTLDYIVTHLFKKLTQSSKKTRSDSQDGEAFLRICELQPEVFKQMLSTVMNIIMFEDCRNQWSMSRPLLGLILLNGEYFQELQNSIVSSQPMEKQPVMIQCFSILMDGIEQNLNCKNRDRFTQNLAVFKRDINESLKTSHSRTSSPTTEMMS